jgi:hypothetical protein
MPESRVTLGRETAHNDKRERKMKERKKERKKERGNEGSEQARLFLLNWI